MTKTALGIVLVATLASGIALAQESEFQAKIALDMEGYRKPIVHDCGTTDKLAFKFDGKLAANPHQIAPGDTYGVTTLCTMGLAAVENVCLNNKVLKATFGKLTDITCARGSGTLGYKLDGSHLTLLFDTKYDKTNGGGQRDALIKAMKHDLDK